MSKSISIILGLIVVLLVGALIAPSFVDWSSYKGRITEEVAKASGYTLKIDGDIALSVLPLPHLTVGDVTVLNGENTLTTIKEADISVELLPLLSKNIAIRSVTLTEPVITLATNDAGEPTWLTKTPEKTADDEADAAQDDAKAKATPAFSIGSFAIENGTFTYKDGQTGKVSTVSQINLNGGMDSLQGPFDVDGSLFYAEKNIGFDAKVGDLKAEDGVPVDITANLDGNALEGSFEGKANLAEKAAAGAFSIKGDDLSDYVGDAGEGAFDAKGKLTASGTTLQITDMVANLSGLTLEGDLKGADDAEAKGQTLTLDLRETSGKNGKGVIGQVLKGASFNGDVQVSETAIAFDNFVAALNGTNIKGNGSYAKAQSKLTADFTADTINLDEWMKLASKSGGAKSSASTEKSKNGAQKTVSGFSLPMDMNVKAQIGQIKYQGKTFSDIAANIAGQKNALRITELKLKAPQNTQIAASGVIGNTENLTGLDLKGSLKTDDIEALADSFNAPLPQSEIKVGALSADATVKGSLEKANFDVSATGKGLTLSANGLAQNPTTNLQLSDLNVRVQHPNMVKAVQITNPAFSMGAYWQKPLDLKTKLNMKDKEVTLTNLSGQAGPVPLSNANLKIVTGGDVPSIAGDIALGDFVLPGTSEGTSNKSSSSGAGAGSSSSSNGKWSSQTIDSGWMRSVKADLKVTANSLTQNRWVLSRPSLDVKLDDGTLNIPSLKASLFGGKVAMSGQIVAASGGKGFSSATWKTDGSSINAAGLYQAMVNKSTDLISGQITSFNEDVKTSGASMAALISNLNGSSKLNGQNIVIKGIDAAGFATAMGGSFKPVDRASELLGATLYKGQTEFTTINGNFPIANGIVSFSPLQLDGPKATFDVTGQVNLPAWTINANNKITIKNSDVPPFDLKIAGSLSNPTKTASSVLDSYLQQRLKSKATEYLQDKGIADKINKKLGIPLLGGDQNTGGDTSQTEPAAGTEAPAQPAQQEQKPEDVLKNAIGGFLGGR